VNFVLFSLKVIPHPFFSCLKTQMGVMHDKTSWLCLLTCFGGVFFVFCLKKCFDVK